MYIIFSCSNELKIEGFFFEDASFGGRLDLSRDVASVCAASIFGHAFQPSFCARERFFQAMMLEWRGV